MTKFTDGPAHGVTLMLRRAPYFLRVVFNGKTYDALDQIGDTAEPNETLSLYRISRAPNWCHVRMAKGQGGMFTMADYEFVKEQPDDPTMRDNGAFVRWCGQQTADLKRHDELMEGQ